MSRVWAQWNFWEDFCPLKDTLERLGVFASIRAYTLLSSESGQASPSVASSASTETAGASLPTSLLSSIRHSQRSRSTIEMGSIDIEASDGAGCTKFDYTPGTLFSTEACELIRKGISPVVCRIVSSRFPATVECTLWAELPLHAWRRLRKRIS